MNSSDEREPPVDPADVAGLASTTAPPPAADADRQGGQDEQQSSHTRPPGAATTTARPSTAGSASTGATGSPEQHLKSWMCGARKKRGGFCEAPAMANGRCHKHGGASPPPGPLHPNYKHGHRSKAFLESLPNSLRADFERASADPGLLSLRSYVAYYDARILDVMRKSKESDSAQFRGQLQTTWASFKSANAQPANTPEERATKQANVAEILTEIDQIIHRGADEVAAQHEVDDAISARMDATLKEQKILIGMRSIMTAEQAVELVMSLYYVIETKIKDMQLRREIGDALLRAGRLSPPAWKDELAVKQQRREARKIVDAVAAGGRVVDAATPMTDPAPLSGQ